MMWKTLIFLTATTLVLAEKVNDERHAKYAFHIKHDYNYLKNHEKLKHHEHEPVENLKEDHHEEKHDEPEQINESEISNAESEEVENGEKKKSTAYEFLYKVMDPYTHDTKEQHEKKHDGEVTGVYWLLQPDGYKRTVKYRVDKHNGFHAKVDYSKSEEHKNLEDHSKPKSEYYIKTQHEPEKYIPVFEEQEEQQVQQQPEQPEQEEQQQVEQEQDKQEASAEQRPIYVI